MNDEVQKSDGIAELIDVLTKHGLAIWRFRWLMVITAVIVSLVAWSIVLVLPNKYQASTKIYVDTKTMLKPVLKGLAVESDIAAEFADITRRTILNTSNLERVMREADLDIEAKNSKEKEKIIQSLRSSIWISSSGATQKGEVDNFYNIDYVHENPKTAYTVVQSVLDIFIESSLGATRKDSTLTESFLNEQISEYERRLMEAEQALKVFKQENINVMSGQEGGYFQQFSMAKDNLRNAQMQLGEAQEREKKLSEQVDQIVSGRGQFVKSQRDAEIRDKLVSLNRQLDELRITYTDNHPSVVAVLQSIDQLKSKQQEPSNSSSDGRADITDNKLFQDLKVAQSNVAADVSALRVRVGAYQREVDRLKGLIDTIPDVEARLAQLNRDYEVNREKYNSLVSRRESASISKQADVSSDQVLFKIIEPPRVPLVALSPNRPLLLAAVYIGSLVLGAALAWLIAQLRPAVMSVKELKNRFGVSVLGSVSVVMSEHQIAYERKKLVALFSVMAVHFVVAATLIGSQVMYDDPLKIVKYLI